MINEIVNGAFYPLTGLFESIVKEVYAEKQRKHERQMKELEIISNSSLRDQYVQQLLLDKFLAPVDNAQHQIQNAAKHAQYLAEVFRRYRQDHGATREEAEVVAVQLRLLAVKISQVESLYDLKLVYEAATVFTHQLSRFRHKERKYSLERAMRKGILDVLNTCIALETNFQRRVAFSTTQTESKRLEQ